MERMDSTSEVDEKGCGELESEPNSAEEGPVKVAVGCMAAVA